MRKSPARLLALTEPRSRLGRPHRPPRSGLRPILERLGWRAGAHEVEQLRTYVRRLRQNQKLEPLNVPLRLVSHQNRGYCLVVD